MLTYPPPPLEGWVANLAGILPLSALIEFTDPLKTLHSYELSGHGLLWNWVITPAGARLLASDGDQASCCLDRPGVTPKLYCMDGRWGDSYPCSNPFTIRTCVQIAKLNTKFGYTNPQIQGIRRQRLQIVRVSHKEKKPLQRTPLHRMNRHDWTWTIVSISGWLLFIATVSGCIICDQDLAAAYMFVLLLTGIVIRGSYGSKPRQLFDSEPTPYSRLVVLCDSLNGNEWTAFIGPNTVVNSLLSKPFYQARPAAHPRIYHALLRVLIATQWALTAVACALQDWNSLVVFGWITLCVLTSSYLYSERNAIANWLRANEVKMEKVEMNFASRVAMLATLVALNPDRESTKWIDPILAPSVDRTSWETALQKYLDNGDVVEEPAPDWWKLLLEGVEVASKVELWVKGMKVVQKVESWETEH